MKSIKPIFYLVLVVAVVTIIIPAILVLPFSKSGPDQAVNEVKRETEPAEQRKMDINKLDESDVEVAVLRSASNQVSKLPLEKYLVGVVAAEMPDSFEIEALKAQALTARTYIINKMMENPNPAELKGADVTDTVEYQVYKSDEELRVKWGADYTKNYEKIAQAVLSTEGEIITYGGKPITASFFSTSNGFTENSEAYWDNASPYLKSVESPWDKKSPKFYDRKTIPVAQFENLLGVNIGDQKQIETKREYTPGKRVASVTVGGKKFSGKQIREALKLKSADFSWERKGDSVIINTKGYGHGIGMSQYGANGMAQEGKTYRQIVEHYYSGIEIASAEKFTKKIVAQK
ncbi:MAG: stage II sporulation protein D [Bacillus sp. (in: firmicutes)]